VDSTKQLCPKAACPRRGQVGQGNVGAHREREQRSIWHGWEKTVRATTGTSFLRLRTPADGVTLVLTRLGNGCPLQAIGAAFGVAERTVAEGQARTDHGWTMSELLHDPIPVPAGSRPSTADDRPKQSNNLLLEPPHDHG
jgi:hypothetical protein